MMEVRKSGFLRIIPFLMVVFFFFSGCLEFESIDQPSSVLPGETFTVFIEAKTASDWGIVNPFFGICLPEGWTIPGDAFSCSGVYNEDIVFDPNLALDQEALNPSPEGYYWWVGYGNAVDVNAGSVYIEIQIQTINKTGLFSIDYMLGTSDFSVQGSYGGLNLDRSNNHRIDVIDEYAPRELRAFIEKDGVLLSWIASFMDKGLKGYNVYRNGHPYRVPVN